MPIPQTKLSGTSRDKDNKSFVESPSRGANYTAQEVYVGNQQDNPMPVYDIGTTPKTIFNESLTDPGQEKEILSYTVAELMLRILRVDVSCSIEGTAYFLVNGVKVATSRTAPGAPNASIIFDRYKEVIQDDVISVNFKARPYSPVGEIEALVNSMIP